MDVERPDEKSIMTYLAQFVRAYGAEKKPKALDEVRGKKDSKVEMLSSLSSCLDTIFPLFSYYSSWLTTLQSVTLTSDDGVDENSCVSFSSNTHRSVATLLYQSLFADKGKLFTFMSHTNVQVNRIVYVLLVLTCSSNY